MQSTVTPIKFYGIYSKANHVIYMQYKKKRKLLNDIFYLFLFYFFLGGGVKIIDCKNDSISVALPFNKELYSEVLS